MEPESRKLHLGSVWRCVVLLSLHLRFGLTGGERRFKPEATRTDRVCCVRVGLCVRVSVCVCACACARAGGAWLHLIRRVSGVWLHVVMCVCYPNFPLCRHCCCVCVCVCVCVRACAQSLQIKKPVLACAWRLSSLVHLQWKCSNSLYRDQICVLRQWVAVVWVTGHITLTQLEQPYKGDRCQTHWEETDVEVLKLAWEGKPDGAEKLQTNSWGTL